MEQQLAEMVKRLHPDAAAPFDHESSADDALQVLRTHLGARYVRDVETFTVGSGFVGRG